MSMRRQPCYLCGLTPIWRHRPPRQRPEMNKMNAQMEHPGLLGSRHYTSTNIFQKYSRVLPWSLSCSLILVTLRPLPYPILSMISLIATGRSYAPSWSSPWELAVEGL